MSKNTTYARLGKRFLSLMLACSIFAGALCPSALAAELTSDAEASIVTIDDANLETASIDDFSPEIVTEEINEDTVSNDEAEAAADDAVSASDDDDVGDRNTDTDTNTDTEEAGSGSDETEPGDSNNTEDKDDIEIDDHPGASEDDGYTDIEIEGAEDTTGSAVEADSETGVGTTTQTVGDAVTIAKVADGATNITKSLSALDPGDVFVDKSVSAGSDELFFDETLTVYAPTQEGGTQYEVGNYIIVLDLTTSICRADLTGGLWNSLAKEASDMAKDICSGSDKNQVMIVGFSCDNQNKYTSYNPSTSVTVLLPMHNWSEVSGNLLIWSSSAVSSQDAALKAGTWSVGISSAAKSYASSKGWSTGGSRKLGNGTWTQAAMAYVGTYLENWSGDKASTNVGVILITDGIPNVVETSNLYATYNASSSAWKGTIDSSHFFVDDSDGQYSNLAKCSAYTMRTVNYWKTKLNQEYNKARFYAAQFDNGVYSNSSGLSSLGMWFVGVQTGYSKIATATSTGKTINYGWPAVRNNSWYNSDHSTPSDYVAPDYVSKSVKVAISSLGSVFISPFLGMYTKTAALSSAQISDALANVFADIEELVKSESNCQPLQDNTYVTFTTLTEKYMTVQGAPTITYRDKSYTGTKSGDTYTYSIDGYSITVKVTTSNNTSTVIAKIPAELVNKNAEADLEQGKTYPIQVNFSVGLFSDDYQTVYETFAAENDSTWNAAEATLNTYTNNYSDAKTTVTYTVDVSNPSSNYAKTDTITANKPENATGTLAYVSQAKIGLATKQTSVVLGNNGKLSVIFNRGNLELTKAVTNPSTVATSLEGFTFRLTGTNLLGQKIDKTAVTDADGKIIFNDILVGNSYTLTEVSSKDGNGTIPEWWDALKSTITPIGISTNTTTTVNAVNVFKTGNVIVHKQIETADPDQYNIDSESNYHYNSSKAGFAFHMEGFSTSGAAVDTYAVTDGDGTALFAHIPIGTYTVTEVAASDVPDSTSCKEAATQELTQYVKTVSQNVTVTYDAEAHQEETAELTFYNILKKWSFSGTGKTDNSLTKQDYEAEDAAKAQGDATLEGAVYGLFDDGQLITTAITDVKGRFDFSGWFIVGDMWYIQEITPSTGYNLDKTKYHVNACADQYLTENQEYFTAETINAIYLTSKDTEFNTVTEQVIQQAVRLHKLYADGTIATDLAGAKFGIYLENDLKIYAKTTDFSGDLNSANDWTEFFRAVRNDEVKADGKIITLTDIPTAKVFENDASKLSGLTATDVKNQYSVDWLTTGDDGYAASPELPYGKYVVYEVATPNEQLDPVQAMYTVISEDSRTPQTLKFSYLDYAANRYIEIIKKDGDTAKTILKAGTQYLIYSCDEDGQYSERDLVRQYYKDGNKTIAIGTKTNPWTTDETGLITTVEELDAGYYAVHEIIAVEGYYNAQQDVIFKVDSEQSYDYRPIYDEDEII